MIDIEADVFDRVARKVLEAYPKAYIASRTFNAPPRFPAVSLVETVSVPEESWHDSSGRVKAIAVTYTLNVFSDSESRAKAECREISGIVTDEMNKMNLVCLTQGVLENPADPSIYRMYARYRGVADEYKTIYRR